MRGLRFNAVEGQTGQVNNSRNIAQPKFSEATERIDTFESRNEEENLSVNFSEYVKIEHKRCV